MLVGQRELKTVLQEQMDLKRRIADQQKAERKDFTLKCQQDVKDYINDLHGARAAERNKKMQQLAFLEEQVWHGV